MLPDAPEVPAFEPPPPEDEPLVPLFDDPLVRVRTTGTTTATTMAAMRPRPAT